MCPPCILQMKISIKKINRMKQGMFEFGRKKRISSLNLIFLKVTLSIPVISSTISRQAENMEVCSSIWRNEANTSYIQLQRQQSGVTASIAREQFTSDTSLFFSIFSKSPFLIPL